MTMSHGFIHLLVDGHLCSHVLAGKIIFVHAFWYTCVHISVVYVARSGITGSQGICILALLVAVKRFSKVVLPISLQPAMYKSFSYSTSLPMLGVASPFNFNYSGCSLVISH